MLKADLANELVAVMVLLIMWKVDSCSQMEKV